MDNKDQRNGSVPIGTFNQLDRQGVPERENDGSADITGAYERVDELQLEPADDDTQVDFGAPRPARKRVRTLLGVPLVDTVPENAASSSQRSEHISQAIQNMLDVQTAQTLSEGTPIQIELEPEPEAEILVPDSDLAELVDSSPEVTSVHISSLTSQSPADEFEARPTNPGAAASAQLPLLIPVQYANAQARDRAEDDQRAAFDADARSGESLFPAALAATEPSASAGPSQRPLASISSLAPRETTRRAKSERDAAPGIGFLWVAAMALIAVGGWYFTAGSFSRANTASPPQAAAAQPPAPTPNESPMAPPPAAPAVVAQAPTPPPTAAQKPSGKRMLTATSHSLRTKTPPAPKLVPDAIAETPTRGEVVQRLESVRSSVRACAAGLSGVADLDITIAHSGVVTHVLVGGDFAGTTQGSCIARAVREARFPSFKQERFRLLYPYAI
jgi:hypothetical protein